MGKLTFSVSRDQFFMKSFLSGFLVHPKCIPTCFLRCMINCIMWLWVEKVEPIDIAKCSSKPTEPKTHSCFGLGNMPQIK